jgi:ATP-dependent DNA ligase
MPLARRATSRKSAARPPSKIGRSKAISEAIDAEGAVVFAKACEMGLEGLVSKRLGGAY